jgi:hypothetical protein
VDECKSLPSADTRGRPPALVAAGRGARRRRGGVGHDLGGGHSGRREEWRGLLVAPQVEFEIAKFESGTSCSILTRLVSGSFNKAVVGSTCVKAVHHSPFASA